VSGRESSMIENLIHRRKAEKDLSNGAIAKAMAAAGEQTSPEAVGHYFTGTSGIPLEKLGAFLNSLGLKVVREEEIFLSPGKYQALAELAKEAVTVLAAGGDARKSRR
jgi:hypothetical protein